MREKIEQEIKNGQLLFELERSVGCVLGALVYAFGVNFFLVPVGLYTGGLMGICQVIRTLLVDYMHLPVGNIDIAGIIYYIMNVPIFIIAMKKLGKKFLAKTVITVTSMTVFMSIIPATFIIGDKMASGVIGGILAGTGIGIILRMSGSSGGMDIVGVLLVKWRRDFSVGKVNMMVTIVLYSLCLFMFDVQTVLYSAIYAAVYAVAIDKVHVQNINVAVNIITKVDTKEMEHEIFQELDRGVTRWGAVGAYTEQQEKVLYIMLSKYEMPRLKAIVLKHDPHAFIVRNEGVRVDGNYMTKL